MYQSEIEYQHSNWQSARDRLYRGVRAKPEPVVVKRTARMKMEALIAAQLAKVDIVPRGRRTVWLRYIESLTEGDKIAELERVNQEWRDKIKEIVVSAGENMARVKAPDRDDHIVWVRKQITAVLRSYGWSTPRIGRFMNKDHSTILNYIKPRNQRKQSTGKALASAEQKVE